MTIRLDYTMVSVVAVCSECGWRTLTLDRVSAWRAALRHQSAQHPHLRQAAKAYRNSLI